MTFVAPAGPCAPCGPLRPCGQLARLEVRGQERAVLDLVRVDRAVLDLRAGDRALLDLRFIITFFLSCLVPTLFLGNVAGVPPSRSGQCTAPAIRLMPAKVRNESGQQHRLLHPGGLRGRCPRSGHRNAVVDTPQGGAIESPFHPGTHAWVSDTGRRAPVSRLVQGALRARPGRRVKPPEDGERGAEPPRRERG